MSFSGSESCPLWFFTFHPLGSRCGPRPCVYAARGDAWRQTSTPHPNNGLCLCSPLLSRLIIRIVSQGEWGCNAAYKLLRGPSLNSCGLTPPSLSLLLLLLAPLCFMVIILSEIERAMKIPHFLLNSGASASLQMYHVSKIAMAVMESAHSGCYDRYERPKNGQ